MKYYLIAGEASGDLHGSNLIRGLQAEDPSAEVRCWGGDLMAKAGANVVKHYRDLAFMGFLEVVKNLPTILRNFRFAKADILQFEPDVLILIDYPGFNLRMVKWAKTKGIRVFYYISPQLWAWHTSRVKIIQKNVERLYVILPFEVAFYKKFGVEVGFPGHPLLDVVEGHETSPDFFGKNNLEAGKPIIALLPGSRRQEIKRMLDVMLTVVDFFPGHQFAIAGAPSIERSFYLPFLQKSPSVKLVENQTYDLLKNATSALVTSGTATLETALFKVPQVVCYRGSQLSYELAKRLVNKDLRFIAIVNLIADEKVVVELIQKNLTTENLQRQLELTMQHDHRNNILKGYAKVRSKLGQPGASERAGKMMVQRLTLDRHQ